MDTTFFSTNQQLLMLAARRLSTYIAPGELEEQKARLLSQTVEIFGNSAKAADESCQANISWIGSSLLGQLHEAANDQITPDLIDNLFGSFYRLVIELELSIPQPLNRELNKFKLFAEKNADEFSGSATQDFDMSRQDMPIGILKVLLNAEPIRNLRNIEQLGSNINQRFDEWETKIATREATLKKIEASLARYEIAFNFVGLFQGFNDLSKDKKKQVKYASMWTTFFGLLAVLPLGCELLSLYLNFDRFEVLKWHFLASAVPVVSITLLFLYFFRIALRNADSAKLHLSQIELRKTLCRFIQEYATYSSSIKKDNPSSLEKFENIIFSNIMSSDEKLPSTFDGVEQIASLIKSMKSAK